jgi:hypothetical protein
MIQNGPGLSETGILEIQELVHVLEYNILNLGKDAKEINEDYISP